jgi:hypothetical protein
VLRPHHRARLVHALPALQHPARLDGAGRQRVGADALRRVVRGQHLGELDERALAGAVGRAAGRGDAAELRGDENHAAATTRDHGRDGRLRHEEGAGQVDPDDAVPRGLIELEHGGCAVVVGGTIEQDVDAAESLDGCRHRGPAAGAFRDVEMHRHGPAAALLDVGGRRLGAGGLDVGAGDARAGGGERKRGGTADPVGGADDDRALAVEPHSERTRWLTMKRLFDVYGRTSGFQRPMSEVSFQSFDIGRSGRSTS